MEAICPFPGLRPFLEEESIFFKGREQQVERMVKRLEEKRFLMVNGASGDGKSSLVYAGLIPYAKAGFFKAKYNQWLIADFRPERSPLKNLTSSICKHLQIENEQETEKKLGYGFRALCEIYKNSGFFVDENSDTFKYSSDTEKKSLKKKGANLLILVDQFEEFFTNPENYQNGAPNIESQKTINLLLETYRIAVAEKLPIYIVCTMRSDYIGQCASFRGLPEAIGYSQFFVPRLKRQEIEQVIEGPAVLAGCKISKRLTQTLINSLTDGFDQLPTLQHALNQIWQLANLGQEEMDLIHLAMAGGLPASSLTPGDRQRFTDWLGSQPSYKKNLLDKPSLGNILNAHANELYITAHEKFKKEFNEDISPEICKKIIEVTFTCLTKVDSGRAVRNRLTLKEITAIINNSEVTTELVGRVLFFYREQGVTFLQPFVNEANRNKILGPEQVLDITHESLIRNWDLLSEWAKEEFENYQNYLDFSKQLQRWVNSNKSQGYLLPIGPLTFFEAWHEKLKPSPAWIRRYLPIKKTNVSQLEETPEKTIQNIQDFLKKSSRRLMVSRFILRYGARKIATYISLAGMLSAIIYYSLDYNRKQNPSVINNVNEQSNVLFHSEDVKNKTKAHYLIIQDRILEGQKKPSSFKLYLSSLKNDSIAYCIAEDMLEICNQQNTEDSLCYDITGAYATEVLDYCSALYLNNFAKQVKSLQTTAPISLSKNHHMHGLLGYCLLMKKNFPENKKIDAISKKIVEYSKKALLINLQFPESKKTGIINVGVFTFLYSLMANDEDGDYTAILKFLCPDGSSESDVLKKLITVNTPYFIAGNEVPKGGYYETLMMLHLSETRKNPSAIEKVWPLLDSTLAYNNTYNLQHIMGVLLKYSATPVKHFDAFLAHSKSAKIGNFEVKDSEIPKRIDQLRETCYLMFEDISRINIYKAWGWPKVLYTLSTERQQNIWEEYIDECKKGETTMDRVQLANAHKFFGFLLFEKTKNLNKAEVEFEKSLQVFENIPIAANNNTKLNNESEQESSKNNFEKLGLFKFLSFFPVDNFAWPEKNGTASNQMHQFSKTKNNSVFYDYVLKSNRKHLYRTSTGMRVLIGYSEWGKDDLTKKVLIALNENKEFIPLEASAEMSFKRELWRYHTMPDSTIVKNISKLTEYLSANQIFEDNGNPYLLDMIDRLAENGHLEAADSLIGTFKRFPKSLLLLKTAIHLSKGKGIENIFYFINQLANETDNKKYQVSTGLYRLLGKTGGTPVENYARWKMRLEPEVLKPLARKNFVTGLAETGNYFRAVTNIPDYISPDNQLELLTQILYTDLMKQEGKTEANSRDGKWRDDLFFAIETSQSKEYQKITESQE